MSTKQGGLFAAYQLQKTCAPDQKQCKTRSRNLRALTTQQRKKAATQAGFVKMVKLRWPGLSKQGVIQFCAAIHLTVSSSIIIFGIGVPPIWQGLLGVVAAMEGHFGIIQGQMRRVFIFLIALVLNVALGFLLGMLALEKQTYSECETQFQGQAVRKEQNFTFTFTGVVQNCAFSYKMYAFVQFGTGVISFACLLLSTIAYVSLLRKRSSRAINAETFLFSAE